MDWQAAEDWLVKVLRRSRMSPEAVAREEVEKSSGGTQA
jgi:hypothetical protein